MGSFELNFPVVVSIFDLEQANFSIFYDDLGLFTKI